MKKHWFLATAFLTLLLILSGCAGESGGDGAESGGDSGDKTKISFIHWRGEDKAVLDEIITEFESANPDIAVEMNIYPSDQYQGTAQRMAQPEMSSHHSLEPSSNRFKAPACLKI